MIGAGASSHVYLCVRVGMFVYLAWVLINSISTSTLVKVVTLYYDLADVSFYIMFQPAAAAEHYDHDDSGGTDDNYNDRIYIL